MARQIDGQIDSPTLQPPVDPSGGSLCHPWFTTTNLSYRFPIIETSATALCGTTGNIIYKLRFLFFKIHLKSPLFSSPCRLARTVLSEAPSDARERSAKRSRILPWLGLFFDVWVQWLVSGGWWWLMVVNGGWWWFMSLQLDLYWKFHIN